MFDVTDLEKYLAFFTRLPEAGPKYGGRPVVLGRFRDTVTGDLPSHQVLLVVEWASEEAFNTFLADPEWADLHPHRENGTASCIWQTFDCIDVSDPVNLPPIDGVLVVLMPCAAHPPGSTAGCGSRLNRQPSSLEGVTVDGTAPCVYVDRSARRLSGRTG